MKKILLILVVFGTTILRSQDFTLKAKKLTGQATKQEVFNGFGCTGLNVSPQLFWENVPEKTQSFAITMYDPDAPTGSGWWHWVVFDIPKTRTEIPENAGNISLNLLPATAIQSKTDFGSYGYGGPCPPQGHGFHQYIITVYALKTPTLGLDREASAALVGYYLNLNTLAKASLVMYYKRD